MTTLLATEMRSRIRILEIQSYIFVVFVIILIVFGFINYRNAGLDTARDVLGIKSVAERARIETEIFSEKLQLTQLFGRFSSVVENNSEYLVDLIRRRIISILKDNDVDHVILDVEAFTKSLNVDAYISYFGKTPAIWGKAMFEDVVDFDRSNTCDNIFAGKPQLREYSIWGGDLDERIIHWFQNKSHETNIKYQITLFNTNAVVTLDKFYVFANKLKNNIHDAVASEAQTSVAHICELISKSDNVVSINNSIDKLDILNAQLSQITRTDDQIKKSDIEDTILHDRDIAIIYVLNKYGPLIIVFFFSSIIITIYKYITRLISFYYGRVFAINALDGQVTVVEFERVAKSFTPDGIDFGRMPRSPLDVANSLAEKVADKLNTTGKKLTGGD